MAWLADYDLVEKQSLASEPATFSMRTTNGANLLGINFKNMKNRIL